MLSCRAIKHVTRAIPILAVSDLDLALRYYRDQLGFTAAWTWGAPPTRVGVVLDDIEIQLVSVDPGEPAGPAVIYCLMTGIDEYYAACRARGAKISLELGERPWGVRDFRVLDPSDNRIGFAEITTHGA